MLIVRGMGVVESGAGVEEDEERSWARPFGAEKAVAGASSLDSDEPESALSDSCAVDSVLLAYKEGVESMITSGTVRVAV